MKNISLIILITLLFLNINEVSASGIQPIDDSFNGFDNFYNVNNENLSLLQSTNNVGLYSTDDLNYLNGLFDNHQDLISTNTFPIETYDNKINQHTRSITKSVFVTFKYPINIKGYYLNMTLGNFAKARIDVTYANGTKVNLVNFNNSNVDGYYPTNLSNVKSIEFVPGTNYVDYNKTINEIEFFVDPQSIYESVRDLQITDLKDKSANIKWLNPVHSDFTGNKVFLDNELVSSVDTPYVAFNFKNLDPDTNYVVKVISVYGDIEISKILSFRTLEEVDNIPPKDATNLNLLPDLNRVNLSFRNSVSDDLSHYELYRNNVLIESELKDTTYIDNDLNEDTIYIYKLIAVDLVGNKSVGISKSVKTLSLKDNIPPQDVSNLAVVEDYTQTNMRMGTLGIKQINALVTYDFPSDDDFSHVEIFRNDKLLNDAVNSIRYMDLNIGEKQTYKYTVKAVDANGNKSEGVSVILNTTFIPDTVAPAAPVGLNASRNNGGGKLSWLKNIEPDLDGYNVYVNGTKYNTTLVKNLSQVLKSLENGTSYRLTVTAVDWSGNESAHSAAIELVPDKNASTDVNLSENYNLKDVADSTGAWFGSLWWIVAFIVGIVIAFMLGRRIKELFLGS